MHWARRVLLLLLALAAPAALAQVCQAELQGELSTEALTAPASGLQAAELFKRAVELLEPALPPFRNTPEGLVIPYGEPGYRTAAYLAQRELLPDNWQPESLSQEVWREMLANLTAWYGLRLEPSGDLSVGGLIIDLSRAIAAAAPRLDPVAIVSTEAAARDRVAFWAVLRSRSVRPRVIVQRPPGSDFALTGGVASAMPYLSTCAQQLRNYVYAPLDTAKRLFYANGRDAEMYLAAVVPDDYRGWRRVPSGEEDSYLSFEAEALAPVERYAAVFYGARLSPATLLRLVTQVRTNMNPLELVRLVLAY